MQGLCNCSDIACGPAAAKDKVDAQEKAEREAADKLRKQQVCP